ncbi:hypothetical protein GQ53DRAFT_57863 [Thozetella sp. PMI_491]|nr:hypothetical protein GQ53DRAFT_57863 [Thozetella sp. PMI_491]
MASVFFASPPSSLFYFPPSSSPAFLPPPPVGAPNGPSFTFSERIYQAALEPAVPITIAALYAVTAKALNVYNTSTGKRPWAISKTTGFRLFVIAHNVFLAVYSAWTWWGMLGALRRSMVSPFGKMGLAGFVDSVCSVQGPAGLGNAVFWNDATGAWSTHSPNVQLTADGMPNALDRGRMWNEGLAFYGWIFYLSKFYEVLDTFIILAKGKLSSTLQTYHHAGAMMCMWAGMRYMSAPIWMFAFVNSGIHALMYTYYTITAFNVRVPMILKRTLTSMQITQFLIGATYAMAHSFVYYLVPVAIDANTFAPRHVPCITTSGATFAIWLNVLYLAPLTYLFASFFVASYIKRSSAEKKNKAVSYKAGASASSPELLRASLLAEKAGWDAAKKVESEVYGQGDDEAAESKASEGSNGRTLRSRKA